MRHSIVRAFTRTAAAPVVAVEPAVDPLRRTPARFYSDVNRMADGELDAGYNAGLAGQGCPPAASRAFWHGWRNGRFDAGIVERDEAARCLRDQAHKAYRYIDLERWALYGDGPENYRRKC